MKTGTTECGSVAGFKTEFIRRRRDTCADVHP